MVLTEEQKRSFIRDGYLVLRNVATREMAKDALRVVDKACAKGAFTEEDALPDVKREAERAPEIYRMMTDTILPEACEDLIGKGKIKYGKNAQIAIRPTEEKFKEKGMTMTENMPKHKWHIDGGKGKYRKTASPFTLLVGVALSEGQDIEENRGQLNVWPGSHFKLHPLLRERVQKDLVTDNGQNLFGYGPGKPDIGQPKRVLLRPGDACIAHQRLGHSGGVNLHADPRIQLYFRVSHKNHDDCLEQILEGSSVFLEFEGIKELVGNL